MYLAPLNYDRFFKKVFSDPLTAKAFLEDFFEVTIEDFELLSVKHKLTDAATPLEFDFRCKMNGQPVIIDMQQWYKGDLVKRFYVYHTVNTAIQMEEITVKTIPLPGEKKKNVRRYDAIAPVITLQWIVDETLDFKDDYVVYALAPEQVPEFVRDGRLWHNPDLEILLSERKKVLTALENKTKSLDFLPQNRLIYAFQTNIVRNKKYSKYFAWFDFAEKTRDHENSKADFSEFEKEEKFMRVIQRLRNDMLDEDDFEYITDYDQIWEQVRVWEDGIRNEYAADAIPKAKAEGRAEEQRKNYLEKLEIAKVLKQNQVSVELIIQATQLSPAEIEAL